MKKSFWEKFREEKAFEQVMMVSFAVITMSFSALMFVLILKVCGSF